MNQQELRQFITPFEVDRGWVRDGEDVEFEILNNSPFDFLCFEQSCGCFGTTDLTKTSFKGAVKAKAVGAHASNTSLLQAGDRFVQLHHTQAGVKFFDPIAKAWVPNEEIPAEPVKVPVLNFHQTITLWLDDGEDFYKINEIGLLEANPNKNRMVIPIKFMIVKPA